MRASLYVKIILGAYGLVQRCQSWCLWRLRQPYRTRGHIIRIPSSSLLYGTGDPLQGVEETVRTVLSQYDHLGDSKKDVILQLPPAAREALGIARHLQQRLASLRINNDCPHCWMQRAHCICAQCSAFDDEASFPHIQRLFVIFHHKEIALKVDTAKLLLMVLGAKSRLVVSGLGPDVQTTMREMMAVVQDQPETCLVLYPDEAAVTYEQLVSQQTTKACNSTAPPKDGWNLIVLDGTWSQARKAYQRYLDPQHHERVRRVQLSPETVDELNHRSPEPSSSILGNGAGHQLRRHVIAWRQIGTFEATRLFLRDVAIAHHRDDADDDSTKWAAWKRIQNFQDIANDAARRELGPPRRKHQ